jgi:hypothetical protein
MFRTMLFGKFALMAAVAVSQTGCSMDSNYYRKRNDRDLVASQNSEFTDSAVNTILSNEPSCIVYKVTQDAVVDPQLEAVMNAAVVRAQSDSRARYTGLSVFQPSIEGVSDAWYQNTVLRLTKFGRSELSIPHVTYYKISRSEFIEQLQCKGQAGIIVAEQDLSLYRDNLPDALRSGTVLDASQVILIVLSRT